VGLAGDEFYSKEWPHMEGLSFDAVLLMFPLATPLGVESDGTVILNPGDYIIKPGEA